jgi:general secretion pathway protein H
MIEQPHSQGHAAAGFTLLELLVVLAILVLVAAVALPRLTGPSDSVRLQTAVRDLIGALRLTRAAAITRNMEMALVIDVEQRTLQSPVVPPRRFETDIASQLKLAETERATPSRGGFRFFPDGSSTGGDVRLRLGGREMRVCVHWLTGQARQDEACERQQGGQ